MSFMRRMIFAGGKGSKDSDIDPITAAMRRSEKKKEQPQLSIHLLGSANTGKNVLRRQIVRFYREKSSGFNEEGLYTENMQRYYRSSGIWNHRYQIELKDLVLSSPTVSSFRSISFSLLCPNGAPSDRKTWTKLVPDEWGCVVLYTVSMPSYHYVLYEDDSINSLNFNIDSFKFALTKLKRLYQSDFIVLFNKWDAFKQQILKVPFVHDCADVGIDKSVMTLDELETTSDSWTKVEGTKFISSDTFMVGYYLRKLFKCVFDRANQEIIDSESDTIADAGAASAAGDGDTESKTETVDTDTTSTDPIQSSIVNRKIIFYNITAIDDRCLKYVLDDIHSYIAEQYFKKTMPDASLI